LARGKRGTLRIRPVSGIAVGQNQAGTEVLSDEAAIVGSALGVVIDARPRPLTLPTEIAACRDMLIGWMDALDALPPKTAYAAAVVADSTTTNGEHASAVPVEQTSMQREDAVSTLSSGDDVAALRDGLVMQPQPKRGFFRRK
jgi:hypothetical protein